MRMDPLVKTEKALRNNAFDQSQLRFISALGVVMGEHAVITKSIIIQPILCKRKTVTLVLKRTYRVSSYSFRP